MCPLRLWRQEELGRKQKRSRQRKLSKASITDIDSNHS
jgi:hypothetical protein